MVTWEPLGDFIWNDLYADDVYISQLFIPQKILKLLWVVEYKYAKL